MYQVEPYLPLQYPASTTVEECQAGGLGHLVQYMLEYNAESPKQDSKSSFKTKHFAHLGILFIYTNDPHHRLYTRGPANYKGLSKAAATRGIGGISWQTQQINLYDSF